MIWGMRAPAWFAIVLASLAVFAWCIVEMTERDVIPGGLIWGLVISGVIGVVAVVAALIAQSTSGGVVRARDALTSQKSKAPRSASGRDLNGGGHVPRGTGDVPQSVSGRKLW